jgi:hypothetical protein
MERKDFLKLSNDELLIEKKKLQKSKIVYALMIGFLVGILIFGIVAWLLSPKKRLGFFIPMLFPVFFIFKMIKNSKKNTDLEEILKQRNLY